MMYSIGRNLKKFRRYVMILLCRYYLLYIIIFIGELSTREPLDRESRAWHEVIVEARDQDGGVRGRSKRVKVKVAVTDVNDNAPVIVDPQQDVVAVREQQPPGVEVVTVKATDPDQGNNATLTYSILKGTTILCYIVICHYYVIRYSRGSLNLFLL